MTLIEEIQNAAVDGRSDLGTLLRRCKLLAARLDNKPFQDWLIWESNGYPDNVDVPEYRVWSLEVKGHFSGIGGSQLQNAPIPMVVIPKNTREYYQKYKCRQSIAAIEAIVSKSGKGGGKLRVGTGDLALFLGEKVYQGMNCLQAWAECAEGHFVEVLNSVRNRIMDFTLAIQKEAPDIGTSNLPNHNAIKPEKLTQIFNTTVYSGTANLVGTAQDSPIVFNIGAHDFESVKRVLTDNGVDETSLAELKTALESEGVESAKNGFGPKVSSWIGKMVEKAASGTWQIGAGAAGNLLARAISKYYGLGD